MGEEGGQGVSGGEGIQGDSGSSFGGDSGGTGSINPAWNEMLGSLPQEYHSQVIPHLQKWDQGVQQRFNQVHSQYENYRPFIENQISPEDINFSLGLLNAVNNDPYGVISALNSWVEQEGIANPNDPQQGGQEEYGEQGQDQYGLNQDPDYQNMRQMVDEMANLMLSQREQEQQARADQLLDDELNGLREQFGDYDEQFVLSRMAAGMTGEEAVNEWQTLTQQILSGARRPGPKVLGGGGALPQNNIDVRKMNSKDTRSLVADMLRQAAEQG